MTEDEAKTKRCPYGSSFDGSNSGRSTMDGNLLSRCVASSCMAWRRNVIPDFRGARTAEQERMGVGEDGHGYCGLAGAPQ